MSGEAGVSKRVRGKPFLCSAELEREKAQVRWAAWGALSRGGRKEGKKVDERTATCKRSSTGVSVMTLVGQSGESGRARHHRLLTEMRLCGVRRRR